MRLLLLVAAMLLSVLVYAQHDIPDFGDFTPEEISLTQCDFDKNADAIVLFDVAYSGYNDEHNLIGNRRIRFKVLKQKGIEKADIEIFYRSKDDFESISNIQAVTYTRADNGEPEVKELNKKAVFTQKINDVISVVKFTLPNVKVGTIVDYSYETYAKDYGGLDDWYFQSDMPVVLSRYILTILPRAEFTYLVHKSPALPIKINSDKSSGTVVFEMKNIGGLRYEPYMDASKDYLQYVEFQFSGYLNQFGDKQQYMSTWKEAARELLGEYSFGRQLEKNLSNADEIINQGNTSAQPYDKMKFIYEYVKNNFTWNNMHARFASDGLKNVWANKKGTSAEINLVLINLLRQAGLQADPMLVSARDHGKVTVDRPRIDQFGSVVACTNINNKKFVLDATNLNTPVNMIPFDILNTYAFIVNNKNPEVIRLASEKSANNAINIFADIDNNGVTKGYASVNSFNYAKISRLEDYKKSKEEFQHNYFEKTYPGVKIDSFEINNTDADSLPLQQQFNFSVPAAVSGDYNLVNVNLFSGLEKNPFILDNRFTDVDFGCTHRTDINETFQLPANMKMEEMLKNVQLVTPDKSISFIRVASLDGNTLTVQISLKINQTMYAVDAYPVLKEFYKKMYNILNEQIVLSKK